MVEIRKNGTDAERCADSRADAYAEFRAVPRAEVFAELCAVVRAVLRAEKSADTESCAVENGTDTVHSADEDKNLRRC